MESKFALLCSYSLLQTVFINVLPHLSPFSLSSSNSTLKKKHCELLWSIYFSNWDKNQLVYTASFVEVIFHNYDIRESYCKTISESELLVWCRCVALISPVLRAWNYLHDWNYNEILSLSMFQACIISECGIVTLAVPFCIGFRATIIIVRLIGISTWVEASNHFRSLFQCTHLNDQHFHLLLKTCDSLLIICR